MCIVHLRSRIREPMATLARMLCWRLQSRIMFVVLVLRAAGPKPQHPPSAGPRVPSSRRACREATLSSFPRHPVNDIFAPQSRLLSKAEPQHVVASHAAQMRRHHLQPRAADFVRDPSRCRTRAGAWRMGSSRESSALLDKHANGTHFPIRSRHSRAQADSPEAAMPTRPQRIGAVPRPPRIRAKRVGLLPPS